MTQTLTRDTIPAVPAGKVRFADYGTYSRELNAEITALEQATAAVHSYPVATLAHETRGYVPAGSVARWQEAQWSVTYWLPDNTRHGRRFLEANEAEARAYFASLTDPQKVSARRQQDAYLEETVYRPAREERAREEAARAAAEKARKAARRKALRAARAAA